MEVRPPDYQGRRDILRILLGPMEAAGHLFPPEEVEEVRTTQLCQVISPMSVVR